MEAILNGRSRGGHGVSLVVRTGRWLKRCNRCERPWVGLETGAKEAKRGLCA